MRAAIEEGIVAGGGTALLRARAAVQKAVKKLDGDEATGARMVAKAVEERRFRQDLYYRLNVARFVLPAIRERKEDIPLLLDLAREWVGILGDAAAGPKMKQLEATLADTYFAWAGPTAVGQGAYFRIQGPGAVIEYAPQGQPPGNTDHIHTIYREPGNDYAAGFIR